MHTRETAARLKLRPGATRLSLIVAVLLLLPLSAHAQQDPTMVMGFGLGVVTLPEATVNVCGDNGTVFIGPELTLGAAVAEWRVGVRGQGFGGVTSLCQLLSPFHWEGVHTDRFYPFGRSNAGSAVALFAHYLQPGGHWSAGGGVGRIWPANRPFIEASGSLRTGGRVALVLRVDQRWVYLPYDLVTAEWEQGEIVREISRESGSTWPRAHSVMLGLDIRFR